MTDERRARVRQTLRLAARYVDRKERGEPVMCASKARIQRLDGDGEPTGAALDCGPFILLPRAKP